MAEIYKGRKEIAYQAQMFINPDNNLVNGGATRVARYGDSWMDFGTVLGLIAKDFVKGKAASMSRLSRLVEDMK